MYFEQAEKYGPLLNIKVAQKKTMAGMVSMVRSLFHYPFLHTVFPSDQHLGRFSIFPARSVS